MLLVERTVRTVLVTIVGQRSSISDVIVLMIPPVSGVVGLPVVSEAFRKRYFGPSCIGVWRTRVERMGSDRTFNRLACDDYAMHVRESVETHAVSWNYDEPLWVHTVTAADDTVLVGGGAAQSTDELVALVRDRNVSIVLAEHGDPDHYGAIPGLAKTEDVEIAVPAGDAQFLEAVGIEPDYRLDSDRSYWGLRTLSVPGHTPDNMAYQVDDVLIAGDTVIGNGSEHAATGDWSGPLAVTPSSYNTDMELMEESVRSLLQYSFSAVLVSHGDHVLKGGHDAVRTLVSDLV